MAAKFQFLSLYSHIKIVHEKIKQLKNYKCDLCGKALSGPDSVKIHIKNFHYGIKDHKCNICDKAYTTITNLKKHIIKVHDGFKNHNCGQCDKAFSESGLLMLHIKFDHKSQIKEEEVQKEEVIKSELFY